MFEVVIVICSALMSALAVTVGLFALTVTKTINVDIGVFGLICYFSWLPGLVASMTFLAITSGKNKAEMIA